MLYYVSLSNNLAGLSWGQPYPKLIFKVGETNITKQKAKLGSNRGNLSLD